MSNLAQLKPQFTHRECVSKVNTSLLRLADERQAFIFSPVTLRTPYSNISYAPKLPNFSARRIRERIRDLGFELVHAPDDTIEQRAAAARARERKHILWRLGIAFLFAIPTFIVAVVGMSLAPKSSAFRQYWEEPIWGMAPRGEIALWILATPVQFGVGSVFYSRSWKSLRAVWRRKKATLSWRAIWFARLFRWGSMVRVTV